MSVTLSATSPRKRWLNRFALVPPGDAASSNIPTASSGGRSNSLTSPKQIAGSSTSWQASATATARGCRATRRKSVRRQREPETEHDDPERDRQSDRRQRGVHGGTLGAWPVGSRDGPSSSSSAATWPAWGCGSSRWHTVGMVPSRGILVGAPHTSNWDWVLTMFLAWDSNVQIRLLVKESFFRGPLAPLLALDRSRRAGSRQSGRDDQGAAGGRRRPTRPSCSASRPRAPAARVSTGSPASTASRGRPASRSPWPSSTRPPGRWGGGRRS